MFGIPSVSYTHLDVYKRQVLTGLGLVWYYMSGQEESPQMTVPAVSEDFPRTIIIDALL